jgi:hypothetical protein
MVKNFAAIVNFENGNIQYISILNLVIQAVSIND